jgi:hypothetical protein
VTPHLPVSEAQWQAFRQRMEQMAKGEQKAVELGLNPELLGELVLLLIDRIDDLQRKIDVA